MLKLFTLLLDCLFPVSCLQCGQGEKLVCFDCLRTVPLKIQELPLAGLAKTLVASDYNSPVLQRLIKAFKYENLPQLDSILGNMLIQMLKQTPSENYVIIPIPLHRQRLNQRGYNQSELLAEQVARYFNYPVLSELRRVKKTRAQARLSRQQRLINLVDSFIYQGEPLIGKNILLIDDVITTGATMEAAAKAVKKAQPNSVYAVAVARNQSLDF